MARTPAADLLTRNARARQAGIAAETARLMIRLWPLLDQQNIDGTTARWLQAVLAVLRIQRSKSATYAAGYATAFRQAELGLGVAPFTPEIAAALDEAAAVTSMMVTGPQRLRKMLEEQNHAAFDLVDARERGRPDPSILPLGPRDIQVVQASVARAGIRHVRNGERDTLDNAVRADPKIRGYVRTTDGDPCFWCAMLASRGPVYTADSFDQSDPRFHGPGRHKVHDGCGCSLEPVYFDNAPFPGRSAEFDTLWRESTNGKSGKDALRAFRQAYEGRRR